MDFGQLLRNIREGRGLTVREVSKRLGDRNTSTGTVKWV